MKKIWLLILFVLCGLSLPASAAGEIIYQGDINSNHIYLTFDDGHSYKNTQDILDILKEKNVCATFFIEGDFLVQNPILINRIVNEQTLGNHTMCHKDITRLSNQQFREDIEKYEKAVYEITGKPVTKYFRPPMGKINKNKQAILNELGYTIFKWDVCYYDYVYFDDRGVDYALSNILNQTKNGSIILMHTLTKSNVKVLSTAIDKLREKGYIFSSLDELI
ncbi:MAG: polysaccharide deacetylase family protein [Roseburia sp.]|nr:polysaccharide deacetylase family protein [Anaeroplasma bactoclasticum]MCM1196017.1 polysaccharide deacetylase family protein [Roseburia sp.]MCM1557089.1 polysaccharide deacetylase family protein [Anaeroplasma bactoclasticum]